MWRSMTSRSKQLVAQGFRASQTNQVLSKTLENEDPELDFIVGIETNDVQVFPFEGLTGDETQMDSSVLRDSQNDMEEEIEACEINVNKLENVMSLLQSKVDGSLESSLNATDLEKICLGSLNG
ncbi:hypothetical protein V6N13_091316 [Hibiscus sabdariffa]|uniref:Uncharacterized protein n=2 Tax=Hibiscus sabdariffa TaxID=183260 RepID=A0ABR2BUV9_9ROSI